MLKMSDAAREAQRAYKKAWYQANKDKVQAQRARYWEKKAAAAGAERKVI